eukprot:gnl/MRDRNA2_/MRDRNA2_14338_c0_seq1.p1 gnl/MRDRNA2_/MRDRNA2_14338_c0~~gnl/MRDRNA2_/MRDRNA2_14338_c0_seq1.p1  ORF type:complete len:421 (+),score=85.28 gnl/MRDRNA2_/MRDRNA2_14338_c0_seq1:100-1362(+)
MKKRPAASLKRPAAKKSKKSTAISSILTEAAKWEVKHCANKLVAPHDAPYPYPGRYPPTGHKDAFERIKSWTEYSQTPLVSVEKLAQLCGIGEFWVKDESNRCGTNSFKVLGGALAVEDFALNQTGSLSGVKVCTASAGNHGLGVAWGAKRAGIGSVIYLSPAVSESIANKMRKFGAEVRRVPGTYEDSICKCKEEAQENGWRLIQDVYDEGYEEIPARIHAGYSLLAAEIVDQLTSGPGMPTHVFCNVGVGGLATGIFQYMWQSSCELKVPRPRLISVEPATADCMLTSGRVGEMTPHPDYPKGTCQTGLACQKVCPLAWQTVSLAADDFVAVSDEGVGPAMKLLADTSRITGGESSVAGIVAMLAASSNPELKKSLDLGPSSRVVCIVCEGPPDPSTFEEKVGRSVEDVKTQSVQLPS